jgi:dTDP-4-amino-4,6-dideoxygalactose transaminase
MGQEVQCFEKALRGYFGRPVVCVVNGTAALHLALQASGIGPDDEVLVQSLTYVASFQAISATGAKPISCDIDPNTMTIDLRDAEKRLTLKTKAIMPVHYSGGVGALDEIYKFALRHGLRVIEDAAHAFGTVYQGKLVGSFGDFACFSFDGIKNITSGEGGCIVSSDENAIRKIRDARLLGVENDTERRFAGERSWGFDVSNQGWRYHMSNIMAAIGVEQLKKIDEFSRIRRKIASDYDNLLGECENIKVFKKNYNEVVPHIYVVKCEGKMNRDEIRVQLEKLGIQTGIHYQPNHLLSKYSVKSALPLKVTDDYFKKIISLPIHADMSESDVKFVGKALVSLTS